MYEGLFSLCGDGRESAIAKSCKDAPIFVFTMGGFPQRADFAMGRPPQRGKSRRRTDSRRQHRGQRGLGLPIGRSGTLGFVSSDGTAAPRSWGSGRRRAMGLAGLRRVECWSRMRQRSWPQGGCYLIQEILYGTLEFWVGLEAHWAFRLAAALRSVRLLRWPRSAENKEFYALAWTSRTAK